MLQDSWSRLTGTPGMGTPTAAVVVLLVAGLLHLVTRRFVIGAIRKVVRRTRADWDDVLFEERVLTRAALLVPLIVVSTGLPLIPGLGPQLTLVLERVVGALLVLVIALVLGSVLGAGHALYQRLPAAGKRPIKGYVQLAKVFLYSIAAIFIVARLAGQSPWFFVSGLGALMAVIMLVFRDTLLSLVAGVQLGSNDLVRVGDWIEMPQFNADGDVVDIALNSVTVQNWDKTVTVIPTHKFLEHSFKNWRAMFETGGRRIKRAIHINTSTIRFLTDEEVERFSRFALLRDYMETKKRELAEFNEQWADDPSLVPHARRLTNVGTLRAYVIAYLRNHPGVHQDMTFLVRQLAPTPEGLPLEIYVFTSDTRWAFYESIQADIFDHILSMVPEFGLRVYQRPAGTDLAPEAHGAAPPDPGRARLAVASEG